MKRTFKTVCAAALAAGLCFGAAVASQAAWNGLNYKNECNTADDVPEVGAVLVDNSDDRAPDGTAYIKAHDTELLHDNGTNALDIAFEMKFSASAIDTFCTWETDIKFTAKEAGFSIRNNSGANQGNVNTTIKYGDNALHFSNATGDRICDAELNQWYHIALTGVYGKGEDNANMTISIYKYGENNGLELVQEVKYPGGKFGTILRNDRAATRFAFAPGTCVDNVTAYEMTPKAVILTTDAETNASGAIDLKAGASISFGNKLYADAAKSMEMSGFSVVYELWNSDTTELLISDEAEISPEDGVLSVMGTAEDQSFVVRVKCVDFPDVYDDITVNVESSPMLEFVGAGFDEEYTTLVNLKFNQNYENEGDISFVAAIYDENGVLMDVNTKTLAYNDQKTGELIVTLNAPLPQGFDKDKDTIKVFAWSKTIN